MYWMGDRCERQYTQCDTNNPCVNGICKMDLITREYICECPPGSYNIKKCVNIACL